MVNVLTEHKQSLKLGRKCGGGGSAKHIMHKMLKDYV